MAILAIWEALNFDLGEFQILEIAIFSTKY